jgi:F-type H+-transporting ATPase subunit delta
MPLLNTIASPYAEALLQVAEQRQETELVAQQAKEVLALWNASPELSAAMNSPVLEPEAKKAAIVRIFGEELTPSFLNLLKLLADRQRIGVLDSVLERFLVLYRELRGIALAHVSSATALSDSQRSALVGKIKAIAGTDNVDVDVRVDPSLIGGFVVSLGSRVIDASLAGQVRRLGLALAKAS